MSFNPKSDAVSELNFFEGGIRPACFVSSPLLPAAVRGTVYSGIVHETDYFKTFATLANANLDTVPKLDVCPLASASRVSIVFVGRHVQPR